jgi:hypothetical protein
LELEQSCKDDKINKLVHFLTKGVGSKDKIMVDDSSGESFAGGTPVAGVEQDAYADQKHDGNFNQAA